MKVVLLQIAAGVSVLVKVGIGFTVTAIVNDVPVQVPADGVTEYVAVPFAVVILFNT